MTNVKDLVIIDTFSNTSWKIVGEHKYDKESIKQFQETLNEIDNEELAESLNEAVKKLSKGKVLEVEGRVQLADTQNANKRVYPLKILQRETNKLQSDIKRRRLLGELDHPEVLNTSLKNVSHLITGLKMEGPEMKSKWEILPTPFGDILRGLYESNVEVGASSRGAGRAIQREGFYEIADDYTMKTIDAVTDPSTEECYPTPLSESQIILPDGSEVDKVNKNENLDKYYQRVVAGLY